MEIPRWLLTGLSLCTNHEPCLHNVFAQNLQRVDRQVQTEVYFVSVSEARPKESRWNILHKRLTMLWLQITSLQALNQENTRDCFAHALSNLLNWHRICKICFTVLTCQQSTFSFGSGPSPVLVIWYIAWSLILPHTHFSFLHKL